MRRRNSVPTQMIVDSDISHPTVFRWLPVKIFPLIRRTGSKPYQGLNSCMHTLPSHEISQMCPGFSAAWRMDY